jgi:D-aminoacyl-tRNA deacylase
LAEPLVNRFAGQLQAAGIPTQAGRFGAHMVVSLENDGPVTILMER